MFSPRFSRYVSRRYERAGLTRIERRMVDFAEAALGGSLAGASILEVGGGVGEIQLDMLSRGAVRATNLELSDSFEPDAERLIAAAGMAGRVDRRLGVDLAQTPDAVGPADVVVLHRVVCCYPDYERLLGAAAGHARRALVFSHPPRNVLTRWWIAMGNAMLSLTSSSFRAFVHPPAAMVEVVRRHGLEPVYERKDWAWCIVGAVRPA
jgi:magnesium-protoporphyrin O-methyltransferase